MMNNRNIDVSVAFGDLVCQIFLQQMSLYHTTNRYLSQDVAKYAAIYRQISFWGSAWAPKALITLKITIYHQILLNTSLYIAICRFLGPTGAPKALPMEPKMLKKCSKNGSLVTLSTPLTHNSQQKRILMDCRCILASISASFSTIKRIMIDISRFRKNP